MTSVPSSIFAATKAEVLALTTNELSSLPDAIARLTELRVLALAHNRLRSLPEAIGALTELQELSAGHNALLGLPSTLGRLSRLEKLFVAHNELTAIPESIFVSGTAGAQMAVIERAPRRAAVRGPEGGMVLVTNDYRALASADEVAGGLRSSLAETSCGRFGRAHAILRERPPCDVEECMAVLRDPGVKMGITVQHMVLSAATGRAVVATPAS